MKNILFENWLKKKVEQEETSFDHEAEWALLRPKLEKKKKRRPVFWFLLPIGLLAVSYLLFTRDSKEESLVGIVDKDRIIIADSKVVDINTIADPQLNTSNEQIQEWSDDNRTSIIQDQEVGVKLSKQNTKSLSNSPAMKNDLSRHIESNYLHGNILPSSNEITANQSFNSSDKLSDGLAISSSLLIEQSKNFPTNVNESTNDSYEMDKTKLNENNVSNLEIEQPIDKNTISKLAAEVQAKKNPEIIESSEERIEIAKQNPKSRFSLSVLLGYGLFAANMNGSDQFVRARNLTEKPLECISAKILLNTKIAGSWSVSTGVGFEKFTTKFSQNFIDSSMITSNGETIRIRISSSGQESYLIGEAKHLRTTNVNRRLYNSTVYYSIPVYLNYSKQLNSRIKFMPTLGLNINFMNQTSGSIVHNDEQDILLQDYKNVVKNSIPSCNLFLGVGVVYNVSKKFDLNLGINGSNQIFLKKFSDNFQSDRLNSYGFYSGLTYKF
jgi:opacity protein-like surface antigen